LQGNFTGRMAGVFHRYLCVSLEARTRKLEGITVLPVKEFLKSLWEGEYV